MPVIWSIMTMLGSTMYTFPSGWPIVVWSDACDCATASSAFFLPYRRTEKMISSTRPTRSAAPTTLHPTAMPVIAPFESPPSSESSSGPTGVGMNTRTLHCSWCFRVAPPTTTSNLAAYVPGRRLREMLRVLTVLTLSAPFSSFSVSLYLTTPRVSAAWPHTCASAHSNLGHARTTSVARSSSVRTATD